MRFTSALLYKVTWGDGNGCYGGVVLRKFRKNFVETSVRLWKSYVRIDIIFRKLRKKLRKNCEEGYGRI